MYRQKHSNSDAADSWDRSIISITWLRSADPKRYLAVITEIALDCGFANRSHLSYHFTKLTRISPKKYRDRAN
jgi:AraC-like DNA-binding protein